MWSAPQVFLGQLAEAIGPANFGWQAVTALAEAVAAIAGIIIAVFLVKLQFQQQRDGWLREYQNLHELFWGDEDMAQVRAWIASDTAYPELEVVLRQRLERGPALGSEAYAKLEKLDKFFNLMLRGHTIFKKESLRRKLSEGLYFDWWVQAIHGRGRERIHNYFRDLWPQSYESLFQTSIYAPFARTFEAKGANPGPAVLVFGAIHGTEPCGTIAIRRFIEAVHRGEIELLRGRVTLVPECNPRALAAGVLKVEENLNRVFRKISWWSRAVNHLFPRKGWWKEDLGRVYRTTGWRRKTFNQLTAHVNRLADRSYEAGLAHELCSLVDEHDVLLDLHSMTAVSEPCVFVDFLEPPENVALAKSLDLGQALVGWPDLYARHPTQTSYDTARYAHEQGKIGLTVECGQNQDPSTPKTAYRLLLKSLEHFGIIAPRTEVCDHGHPITWIRFEKLVTRDHERDVFAQDWTHGEGVAEGRLLATRHTGEKIHAPADCFVLLPARDAAVGKEWLYLGKEVSEEEALGAAG